MPKIKIITDGTVKGTQCIKDGVDLTAETSVLNLSLEVDAGMDLISMSYTTQEDYINEKGEAQGKTTIRYSYINGEFVSEVGETPSIGKDSEIEPIGGKIIEDISGTSKATRLVTQRKESR